MDELTRTARRYQRRRLALERDHEELVRLILEARGAGLTLRAIAAETGLSFARVHQIEKEARHG